MTWDPDQYLRFAAERALPFCHLVAAVDYLEPSTIIDLLERVRGTTLRSVLGRLPSDEHDEFLSDYGKMLREACPARAGKTVFPFKRTFVVAHRKGSL